MYFKEQVNHWLNTSEDAISMFLGLIVVFVVVGLIFNFVKSNTGVVDLPGISNQKIEMTNPQNNKVEEKTNPENIIYEVKKGDNLWKIAEAQYGSGFEWTKIAKDNDLKNPRILHSGQKLTITVSKEKITENGSSFSSGTQGTVTEDNYIVHKSDSLWKIAVSKYGDGYQWTKIWNANKNVIKDPGLLEIGMELVIPQISKQL